MGTRPPKGSESFHFNYCHHQTGHSPADAFWVLTGLNTTQEFKNWFWEHIMFNVPNSVAHCDCLANVLSMPILGGYFLRALGIAQSANDNRGCGCFLFLKVLYFNFQIFVGCDHFQWFLLNSIISWNGHIDKHHSCLCNHSFIWHVVFQVFYLSRFWSLWPAHFLPPFPAYVLTMLLLLMMIVFK